MFKPMFDRLSEKDEATCVQAMVDLSITKSGSPGCGLGVYRDGKTLTPDQGGTAKTRDMAQAVLAAYRNA